MAIHYTDAGVVYTGTNDPAQDSGSGAAYTLNDYEEGTWSPTSQVGTLTDTGYTEYTKIGRWVEAITSVVFGSTTSNGAQYCNGLPWLVHTTAYAPGMVGYSQYTGSDGVRVIVWNNAAQVSFYPQNATNPQLSATNLANLRMDFTVPYFA